MSRIDFDNSTQKLRGLIVDECNETAIANIIQSEIRRIIRREVLNEVHPLVMNYLQGEGWIK